jgi:Tfp pilus assembly protein FimT
VVVLAIVALLVGLAAPFYLNYSSNQRVLAATRTLSSTIRAAQQEAVTRRTMITVMFSQADVVCPNGAASHTLVAEEEVIKRTCLASDLGWASRPEAPLVFQSTGPPSAGATVSIRSTRTGRTHTVTIQADTGAVSDDAR